VGGIANGTSALARGVCVAHRRAAVAPDGLVGFIPDHVRLSSGWFGGCREREGLTKPCSRIAMASCGVVSWLAAIC
jgi:hypothetical protein